MRVEGEDEVGLMATPNNWKPLAGKKNNAGRNSFDQIGYLSFFLDDAMTAFREQRKLKGKKHYSVYVVLETLLFKGIKLPCMVLGHKSCMKLLTLEGRVVGKPMNPTMNQ